MDYGKLSNEDLIRAKKELEKVILLTHTNEQSRKLFLNSAYGACGSPWFRYYDLRMAEAVTLSGQYAIKAVMRGINKYLNDILKTGEANYVLAGDTDSAYITLAPLVEKVFPNGSTTEKIVSFLDKVCKEKIEPVINKICEGICKDLNCPVFVLKMKREAIADKAIWTGKKHYIMSVLNNEGVQYNEPKYKILGIETVKSSTPASCRGNLQEAIKIIMQKDQESLLQFIEKFRGEFEELPVEEIAFPRGVNDMEKYASRSGIDQKGCPIAVRGALLFNHWVARKEIGDKYEKIRSGDKIKFLYLKTPNGINENVIAFAQSLPEELGCHRYVDRETQFQKAFLEPLKSILEVIGWNHERRNDLSSFFG